MAASNTRKSKHAREICGELFPTAKAIRSRCREILDQYEQTTECPDVEMSDDHTRFFVELTSPGMPVVKACKSTSDGQMGRHVRFFYRNGTTELIGWSNSCGSPPSRKSEANAAMRFESSKTSRDVISRFFSGRGPWRCQKTGDFISISGGFEGEFCCVHHDGEEWSSIRDAWLADERISIEDVAIEEAFDGRGCQMKPGPLRDSWRRFHDLRANLVVVSQSWHKKHHASNKPTIGEVDE